MARVPEEMEEVLASDKTQDTLQLDSLVGHIEDIILSNEFSTLRENFLKKHCHLFDDNDENKLEYMDIFKQYTNLIEGHIEKELSSRASGFQMSLFLQELTSSCALDGEVFDLLMTFTDFLSFKTAMLEIKQSREDGADTLEDLLQITSLKS
ncbi:ADP-ribosylation factor-like protein 2-binding protein [Cherax quadricarinatus]|nr:ADP-ribosylation factor-like protein 2-binding protein [Cherax quadricarinatus]XP_053640869.1 ADP-ribosylation factor-like protein 2-binding protein [Cherax quadricarinatus]XP_053640870.1 ADP-ribosylation factor-like protein 2-binding protein [Cherax quadricarinatus]XP_053640871.1 ADP-ribosylation factor-like protein 2-binding protein [Cherax quadricarinatus]XP_053640872.1 ADP-ribosylation factor-like protein 2-binding protein [Cherax quadricarinatus]